MPTSTNVTNLKINELTEAQYDAAVQGGTIGANELSVITDMDIDAIQVSSLPTAAAGEVGKVYQFIGTTDASYTHGYFYECVSDGGNPATYSWSQLNVQPSSGGQIIQYDTMPTGSAELDGKIIQYTGTTSGSYVKGQFYRYSHSNNYWYEVSVAPRYQANSNGTVAIGEGMVVGSSGSYNVNYQEAVAIGVVAGGGKISRDAVAIGYHVNCVGAAAIGYNASVLGNSYGGIAVGSSATVNTGCNSGIAIGGSATLSASSGAAIAIGSGATVSAAGAIQIGTGTNSDANTLQVKTYSLVSSDGTIPHARLTNAVVSNSITIAVADWNGGTTCSKTVSGLTATSVVWVAPDNASQSDYLTAGVYASAQTTDTITFTCTTTPTSALTVNVIYC